MSGSASRTYVRAARRARRASAAASAPSSTAAVSARRVEVEGRDGDTPPAPGSRRIPRPTAPVPSTPQRVMPRPPRRRGATRARGPAHRRRARTRRSGRPSRSKPSRTTIVVFASSTIAGPASADAGRERRPVVDRRLDAARARAGDQTGRAPRSAEASRARRRERARAAPASSSARARDTRHGQHLDRHLRRRVAEEPVVLGVESRGERRRVESSRPATVSSCHWPT